MKLRTIAGVALTLSMSIQAKAANMVLAAESLKCGGIVTLEKTAETLVVLRLDISASNTCKNPLVMEIKSQDIKGTVNTMQGSIELNPHAIGGVLPVNIGDETLLLKLSDQAQQQVASANTRADLTENARRSADAQLEAQRRQAEMDRRQRQKNAAGAAAVGGAVVIGAGAAAAAAAASTER